MNEHLYPVTIFRTRYGGIYEGGEWAAFPVEPDKVPPDATGSDTECLPWWQDFGGAVGLGPTPDAALADLDEKVRGGQLYRG